MVPGTRVRDYIFERRIGQGGMGEVWQARHALLDRLVAVKIMADNIALDPNFEKRFLREARAMDRLEHPRIVGVREFFTEAGHYYLIMTLLQGRSLEKLIAEAKGPMVLPIALQISVDILQALDYAHQKGIIHRDVKPSNILLDKEGNAYLTDFGIALMVGESRQTKSGAGIGTPHYMSPEQISNPRGLDHRSDEYSMGCVVYEMLTGRPPFDDPDSRDSDFTVMLKHIQAPPITPLALNPKLPQPLVDAVMKALSKNPNDRYPGCGVFCKAIQEIIERYCGGPGADIGRTVAGELAPVQYTARLVKQAKPAPVAGRESHSPIPETLPPVVVHAKPAPDMSKPAARPSTPQPAPAAAHPSPPSVPLPHPHTPPPPPTYAPMPRPSIPTPQPPATPLPDRGTPSAPGHTGSRPPMTGTAAPSPPRPSGSYPQNAQAPAPWQPPQGPPHPGMAPPAGPPTLSRRGGPPSAEHPAPPTAERAGTGRTTTPPATGAPAPDGRKTGTPATGTQLRPTGGGQAGGTRPGTGPLQPKTGPRPSPGQAFQAQAGAPKSKLPLILGAAGLLVVVIVLVLFFATGKSPEPSPGPEKPASPETPGPEKPASFMEQTGMKFVKVAAGKFKMGSDSGKDDEKPAHDVTISKGFFVSATEVTEKQWRAVMGESPATSRGDEYPVEVSWEDAQRFLKALGEKAGKQFRLPTEAEWEYACRAGESGDYYWGASFSADHCWFNGNSGGKPQPVGSRKPNAWGLFDMAGNVYEWCQDWKSDAFYATSPPADPRGPDSGEYKIVRGGSWDSAEDECRSAYRAIMKPTVAGAGFRVVTNDPVP